MADRHQVYMSEDTTAWLLARAEMMMQPASAPKQARAELGLWRAHLDAELVCVTWTLGEIGCIADVLNRPVVEAAVGSLLWAYLADAFDGMDGAYAAKWGIDEAALIERARKLGPAACHALTAAVWAWWTAGEDHSRDGWARVGVRVIEP